MQKKSWFGNRIDWHPVRTPDGRSGRAARVMPCRKRLPWLSGGKMVSAFISHKDFTLEFFDTQQIDTLDPSLCFFTMDRNSLSLSKVAEFLNWPSSEAVYAEYTGYDLAEMHPSSLFADQLYNRWASAKVPGWHIIDRGAAGISLVSELTDISGQKRAIELTDYTFAAYKKGLLQSSAFDAKDQIACLLVHKLETSCLKRLMSTDDAVTVRMLARRLRYWLYQEAVRDDFPF